MALVSGADASRFGREATQDFEAVLWVPCQGRTLAQAVLTEIQNLRQGGQTLWGIAAALNYRALRTRRGSAWRLEHVARILRQGGR